MIWDDHDVSPDRPRVRPSVSIANDLRRRIQAGEWPPDAQIPSVRELADEYGVARRTVSRAIEMLVAEQLLDVQRGWGTFVSGGSKDG